MQERRLDVMQAVQRLRESWARVRDWDQQLAEAQAALAEAHSRFSEFYDFVPTPFLVLDDRLRILQINAAGSAFLDGVRRFTGQPFVAYVGQEDLHRLMTALAKRERRRPEAARGLRVRSGEGWVPAQLTAKVSQRPRAAGTGRRRALLRRAARPRRGAPAGAGARDARRAPPLGARRARGGEGQGRVHRDAVARAAHPAHADPRCRRRAARRRSSPTRSARRSRSSGAT